MESLIYLDHAATTRVSSAALSAMLPYFQENYGNASSIYSIGTKGKAAVNKARAQVAGLIKAQPREIYFTAGGSEADNWALKAAAEAYRTRGKHIITTRIEHHAVLHTAQYLEKSGYEVTYLDVDEMGLVRLEDLEKTIRPDTILISVMFANNEIGTLEPIREIAEMAHQHGILFHTDAVQAYGQLPIDVQELQIDLLSASAHKLNGPKGIGFLYIRNGIRLQSLIHGGAQERGRRAGTENVPAIVGFGAAAEEARVTMEERICRETELRDYLIQRILREIPLSRLNGHPVRRLPGNAHFSFRFVEGEALLILLDMQNICASSGSACTSGSLDPSHVLEAIGLSPEDAKGSLRLTLGSENTREEIDYTVDTLRKIVEKLRGMSLLYENYRKTKSFNEKQKDICIG